jgi:hypothetical protein
METAAWDDWRTAPQAKRLVGDDQLDLLDRLATKPEVELTEVRPDWLD